MEADIKKTSEILSAHGIKPSHQRIKIYQYLSENFIHPTADQVYDALKGELPTLSRSTVYSTLKAFVSADLIRSINIEENEVRYEFNLDDHGHFKCNKCGNVYDFKVDIELPPEELKGFTVKERNVFFNGICKTCSDNKKEY